MQTFVQLFKHSAAKKYIKFDEFIYQTPFGIGWRSIRIGWHPANCILNQNNRLPLPQILNHIIK